MVYGMYLNVLHLYFLYKTIPSVTEILLRLDRDFYHNGTPTEVLDAVQSAKEGVINRISDMCGRINLLDEHSVSTLQWTFYNSVFFAFTAITTIGNQFWSHLLIAEKSLYSPTSSTQTFSWSNSVRVRHWNGSEGRVGLKNVCIFTFTGQNDPEEHASGYGHSLSRSWA
jgi:hypothetical protein